MTGLTEAEVEDAAVSWLAELGWSVAYGSEVTPESAPLERADYSAVVLAATLRDALARLNPGLPPEALSDALRRLNRPEGASVEARNRAFHRMVIDGVTVEYRDDGRIRGSQARVLDFDDPSNNDWLAVNQLTVVENKIERRPDIVLFVNGLPLGLIELKNPTDPDATIWTAWQQLQTYKADLPTLFSMNAALMVSDGLEARLGTLTAGREWFKPWRTISGEELADETLPQLQVLLQGVCDRRRFLDLVRDFIVFEDDASGQLEKKIAGYHQFHAVEAAVGETLRAAALQDAASGTSGRRPGGEPGDRRIGVVWHTQGSGKSLTMAFYAGRVVREPAMSNPTVVVLTDRNDLDDQLFSVFSRCADLLRQPPAHAKTRAHLRQLLTTASGGVVFTTIQKFFPDEKGDRHPLLSDRRNIVVIADEAHRSQYDFIDGFAAHMRDALPNASFIGFTGTPVERADASTPCTSTSPCEATGSCRPSPGSTGCSATSPAAWLWTTSGSPTNSRRRWPPTPRAAAAARPRSIRPRPWRRCSRSTRYAVACSGASTGRAGPTATRRRASGCCPPPWSTSWPRKTARTAAPMQ